MNQNAKKFDEPNIDEMLKGLPDGIKILDILDMLPDETPAKAKVNSHARDERDKKKKRLLLVCAILMLGAVLLLLFQALGVSNVSRSQETPSAPVIVGDLFPGVGEAQDGALSSMSKEDVLAQMQMVADENYFSFKINKLLVFEDGQSEALMGIENPNYNVYPMVIQIYLGEDGKGDLIYDSGGLLPNQHIDDAKLIKELPKGTYKALAQLHAYDPDTQFNVFKSTAELTIIIQN